eukprot:36532-Eustigmatos_ZCMA.PRE.1
MGYPQGVRDCPGGLPVLTTPPPADPRPQVTDIKVMIIQAGGCSSCEPFVPTGAVPAWSTIRLIAGRCVQTCRSVLTDRVPRCMIVM